MKQSDSQQILELLTRLTDELVGPAKRRPRTGARRTLSERVDNLDAKVTGLDAKVTGLDAKLGTSRSKQPLAGQVDALTDKFDNLDRKVTGLDTKVTGLDTKVTGLDKKLGTSRRNIPIAVQLDALDTKVEKRFESVNRNIDATRDNIVDLVNRVHSELTNRVVDLEVPEPGRKGGGGRGSGGSGVPLAS